MKMRRLQVEFAKAKAIDYGKLRRDQGGGRHGKESWVKLSRFLRVSTMYILS